MVALAAHEHDGNALEAWASRLDNLLPAEDISTTDYAVKKRVLPDALGDPMQWDRTKTPYIPAVQDALDMPDVGIVALQSSARWGKTVAAENKCMKHWTYGPRYNVLWYMHAAQDLSDYVDERFEWMLENHEEVDEQINWSDPRNGRFRKQIGPSLLLMKPATKGTTRSKAAPIIVADELDAYAKAVRSAMDTLINNRQREFGANAIAYICSHPDAGPLGVAGIIARGLIHKWWWNCPKCRRPSTPCQGSDLRMAWNVPELMKVREDMDELKFLDLVQKEARLICPYGDCQFAVDEDHRLPMSNKGAWLQPGQKLRPDGTVSGKHRTRRIMGFIGHAMMSPFVTIGELARDWAAAKIIADDTGDDTKLREETVKSLGEEYGGADAETLIEPWNVVRGRLSSVYQLKVVPRGVKFLTAFVDVQGDRFEVVVIGWNLAKESWLVDRFSIKEWPRDVAKGKSAFADIDPANRLSDWDLVEEVVVKQIYVTEETMFGETPLFMPIAKTMVNAAGSAGDLEQGNKAGVSNTARVWLSNLVDPKRRERTAGEGEPRDPIEEWRVTLFVGSRSKDQKEIYGKAYAISHDEHGKQLQVPVFERAINVHQIKRLIAKRMKIAVPSPGRMYLPSNLPSKYVRELVSEKLVNDQWTPSGRNETWDGWVACEAGRALLQPDRPGLWDETPVWAWPRPRSAFLLASGPQDQYERLLELNRDL